MDVERLIARRYRIFIGAGDSCSHALSAVLLCSADVKPGFLVRLPK